MKKFTLTETELTNIIQKSVLKKLEEQDFSVEPKVPMTKREKELEGVFGSYGGEVPADVLRYMRKNPKMIMKRMFDIYGEKLMDYMPYPEDEIEMDDVDDIPGFEGTMDALSSLGIREQEEESMEQQYPVDDIEFELDDSDVNEIMSTPGPKRRFRGSIYVDGLIPETDDKEYDRKLAIKILENYGKKLPTSEYYVGGAGFKQRSLIDPYDNMDF
jgi:hypothetical protein